MKNSILLIFISFMLGCSFSFKGESEFSKKEVRFSSSEVIYGIDDRFEIDDWDEEGNAKELSRAVLSLYRKKNGDPAQSNKLPTPLCEEEPFRDQSRDALCTGILVAPDIVLTAGHCLKVNNQCKGLVWKFDYPSPKSTPSPLLEKEKNFYRCSHVIRPKDYYQNKSLDFVFVKLTEPVLEREPISLEEGLQQVEIEDNEKIFAIGNPSGLPLKVMKGRVTVKSEGEYFFKTNIDSYRGNSGGPIFTSKESRLIGLLLSGEKDFEFDSLRSCYYSKKCLEGEESGCSGEKAISISKIYESYKWVLENKNKLGKKVFSDFQNFERACSSDELDSKSRYFLSLLEEKARSQDCKIIKSRLEKAKYLDLNSSSIEDSYALSFFDNLEFLNLENNNIRDFNFLKSFSKLKLLYLKGNKKISDLKIENLKSLKKLSFTNGRLFIDSLKEMSNLSSLHIDSIDSQVLTIVSELKELKELVIEDSNLLETSFLRELRELEKLSLKNNKLKETLFISKIQTLRSLDISENLIEDLSPLYSLEKLYSFKADGNPIKECPMDGLSFPLRHFCKRYTDL